MTLFIIGTIINSIVLILLIMKYFTIDTELHELTNIVDELWLRKDQIDIERL